MDRPELDIENPHNINKGQNLVLTLAFVAMALAGLLIAYSWNQSAHEKAKVAAEHYQAERAQTTVSKIRAFLLNATQLSETLRVLVEKYDGRDGKQIEEYLDRIVESAPEELIYGAGVWFEPYQFAKGRKFYGPYVHRGVRPGSRVLTSEWENPDYNFHQRDWYKAAIHANGEPTFTEPYFDNGMVYMTLAVAFNDRKTDQIRGVVTVDMILPQLQHLVDSVNENSSDLITVVGREGHLLAHPNSRTLLQVSQAQEPPGTVHSLLDVPAKYYKPSPWSSIVHETMMVENGWKVIVSSPLTSVMAAYVNQRTLIIALTLFYEVALLIIFITISFFNEGMNRLKERAFEALSSERNQIKAIVDNVQFGLFRADRLGRIQSGYSASCRKLLAVDPRYDLSRRTFWLYFDLSEREEFNYRAFYEQVFEVPYLASEMVDQIPSQITLGGKILSCRYYPIMNGEEVESILITISYVSRSRFTEMENENNKALIRILRNKERFRALVHDILSAEDTILSPEAWTGIDGKVALRRIKRMVHTWKGDLATFGLVEAAGYVHTMEDGLWDDLNAETARQLLHVLKSILRQFLESNQPILRITAQKVDERLVTLPESALFDFGRDVARSHDLAGAQELAQQFVEDSTREKAEDVLSYLSIAALEIAKRQDKDIKVFTQGGELSFPGSYRELLSSLIHIVRNAVDHGFEKPKDRLGKARQGSLTITFAALENAYEIVIADDGRGIDKDKLKAVVLRKGAWTEEQWDKLSAAEQLRSIFLDAISTRTNVTCLSGRGVGLSQVLAAVEALGGTINVGTESGLGTRFTINLPKADYTAKRSAS